MTRWHTEPPPENVRVIGRSDRGLLLGQIVYLDGTYYFAGGLFGMPTDERVASWRWPGRGEVAGADAITRKMLTD